MIMIEFNKGLYWRIIHALVVICFFGTTTAHPSFALRNNSMFDNINSSEDEKRIGQMLSVVAREEKTALASNSAAVEPSSFNISREDFLKLAGTGLLFLAIAGCSKKNPFWSEDYTINPSGILFVKGCDGVSMSLPIDASEIIGNDYSLDKTAYDLISKIFSNFPIGSLGVYINDLGIVFVGDLVNTGAYGRAFPKRTADSKEIYLNFRIRSDLLGDVEEVGASITVDGKLAIDGQEIILDESTGVYKVNNPKGFTSIVAHELSHFVHFNLQRTDPERWDKWVFFPRNKPEDVASGPEGWLPENEKEDFARMMQWDYYPNTLQGLRRARKNLGYFPKKFFYIADLFSHYKNGREVTWVFEIYYSYDYKPEQGKGITVFEIRSDERPLIRNEQGEIVDIDFEKSLFTSTQKITPDIDRAGFFSLLIPGLKAFRDVQSDI